MSETTATEPLLWGGRYEQLDSDEQGIVTVRDHQPWRKCWQCGATDNYQGDAFCANCGARLEPRDYRGMLTANNQPNPLVLLRDLPRDSDPRLHMLPTIADELPLGNDTLVLLLTTDATQLPSDREEPLPLLVALQLGEQLADMLAALHAAQVVMGVLTPDMVGLTPTHQPAVIGVPYALHRVGTDDHAARHEDVQNLAELLEALTGTGRTTRRLSDEAAADDDDRTREMLPSLAMLLSDTRTGTVRDAATFAARLHTLLAEQTKLRPLRQHIGAISDTGRVRDHNEDSLLVVNLALDSTGTMCNGGVYVVADGMGGHAAGEIASYLAVRNAAEHMLAAALTDLLAPNRPYNQTPVDALMHGAVGYANEAVRNESLNRGNDMGTTLTLALVVGDRATIANVGDSRTYLLRAGKLQRITRDHSLVMRLVELGQLREEDIYTHPQRNAVLRSLGDHGTLDADIYHARLQPGDALLLCSDGLWEMVRDPRMQELILRITDPQQACEAMVAAANEAGGEDNITAVLVRLTAMDEPLPGAAGA